MWVRMKRRAVGAAAGIMGLVLQSGAFGWEITLDDVPLRASERAWVADSGQVMVAVEDLVPELINAYAFDFDGWQITIVADGFGITAMVTSRTMKRNGFAATFEEAPTVKDQVLWFPIEALATIMNYTAKRYSRLSITCFPSIHSP